VPAKPVRVTAPARRTILATSGGSRPTFREFLAAYPRIILHKPLRGPELLAAIEVAAASRG